MESYLPSVPNVSQIDDSSSPIEQTIEPNVSLFVEENWLSFSSNCSNLSNEQKIQMTSSFELISTMTDQRYVVRSMCCAMTAQDKPCSVVPSRDEEFCQIHLKVSSTCKRNPKKRYIFTIQTDETLTTAKVTKTYQCVFNKNN